jgi:hypothetical protein
MADKNVSIDIIAADRTKAAFESVKKGLGEVDSKLSMVKGTIGAFSAIAASAGLTQMVSAAVQAAAKAEDSSKRLDAVLRATGNTVGFTRDQLDSMADAMAKATTFDDEGVRDAMSVLAKFGKLHGDIFQKALKLSADYAAFTGGDMAEAAQAVGKAFADPVNGGMMLERQFGKLTDAQDASIKKFMEQGKVMEAQQVWVEKLEKSIGGTAGAMNEGMTGAIKSAEKAWDELMETMGKSGPSKIIVENGLLSMATLLELVNERLKDANKETQRLIETRGQLQPLPQSAVSPLDALKGSKMTVADVNKLPPGSVGGQQFQLPSDFPKDLTAEQVAAQGRAARAAQDQAAAEIRAANEKRAAELQKARRKAQDEIGQETYARWQAQMKAHLKVVEDLRKADFDNAVQMGSEMRALYEADQKEKLDADIESGAHMKELFQADQTEKLAAYTAMSQRIWESGMTDQELLRANYEAEFDLLNQSLTRKYFAEAQYRELMQRLVRKYEKDKTALEDAEIRKRYGIANVYRKADLGAAGFFADQMGTLMQTKSRTLFEIGKAGAIAGAVIDSYKAATGSYAALAGIPIIGPALGAAAAAAAIAVGFARVSAIKSTSFGGGGGGGGAVGTFAANPSTGLPEDPTSSGFDAAPVSPLAQRSVGTSKTITVNLLGNGRYTQQEIRDQLIPALNEAAGDGVTIRVN